MRLQPKLNLKLKNEAFLRDLIEKCHADQTFDLRNDAFPVASGGISRFVMWMFEASGAESWKGCKIDVMEVLLCRGHFAWQLQEFVCLGSTLLGQPEYFCGIRLKIVQMYCNSDPLQIHQACQRFCNPHEFLRLPRVLQPAKIRAFATQNAI